MVKNKPDRLWWALVYANKREVNFRYYLYLKMVYYSVAASK